VRVDVPVRLPAPEAEDVEPLRRDDGADRFADAVDDHRLESQVRVGEIRAVRR
jgi:hypothetical protein